MASFKPMEQTMDMITINRQLNQVILRNLKKGDIVTFKRPVFLHYAVYVGNDMVIHLTQDSHSSKLSLGTCDITNLFTGKCKIAIENFWVVAGNDRAEKDTRFDNIHKPFPPDEIVSRAESKLGPLNTTVSEYNCEHFATWCRYGQEISSQKDNVKVAAFGGAALLALAFPVPAGLMALGAAASYFFGKKNQNDENMTNDGTTEKNQNKLRYFNE